MLRTKFIFPSSSCLVSGIHPHKAKLDSRLRGNDERKDDVLELKLTKWVRWGYNQVGSLEPTQSLYWNKLRRTTKEREKRETREHRQAWWSLGGMKICSIFVILVCLCC